MSNLAKTTAPTTIISQMEGQFAKVLPKVLPPERFCRVALSAVNKNPTLLDALKHPGSQASVLSAFMKAAEMGLEPDGRKAFINAFRNNRTGGYDVTLIPMYQGLSELVMRSGLVSFIHADKVCENDEFDWDTGKILKHRPKWGDRGKVILFYCHVVFKDGSSKDEVMDIEEVNAIRDRSTAYNSAIKYGKKETPWIKDYDEMGKKTVFRRCAKWLPLSSELRTALAADDEDYSYKEDKNAQGGMNDNFAKELLASSTEKTEEENMQEEAVAEEQAPEEAAQAEPLTESKESLL